MDEFISGDPRTQQYIRGCKFGGASLTTKAALKTCRNLLLYVSKYGALEEN